MPIDSFTTASGGAYQQIDLTWFAGEIGISAIIGLISGVVNCVIAKCEKQMSEEQSENPSTGHRELQSRPPRSESML